MFTRSAWRAPSTERHQSMLGTGPQGMGYQTFNLSLAGYSDKVDWVQDDSELGIKLPKSQECKHGLALRVRIPGVPIN